MPLVQRPRLLIVITVGSTKFISLSQTIISQELVTVLSQRRDLRSHIQVLIQIGNQELRQEGLLSETPTENISQFNYQSLSHLKLNPTANIELVIFQYSDKIDQLISQAQLVITHAGQPPVIVQKKGNTRKIYSLKLSSGAGSILSAIKPMAFSRPSTTISQIEITPDYSLEISADRLSKPQVIIVPNPELMDNHQTDLAHQISSLGLAITCSTDRLIQTIEEALNSSPSDLTHAENLRHLDVMIGPSKFKNLLDHQMGFSDSTRD
ncbi:uncharacterized protein VP01_808g4 [Puccinia sorghi]|uniref:UDP-N-acetylglucosamine transferase subunit ALG13 n=1 Tax=Puccinia sorghi TaxID=27349 RepID=A0A0L6UCD9_9BASI|nr:uncharacterized protein VP01_808g4 [Puccinia sorghi]